LGTVRDGTVATIETGKSFQMVVIFTKLNVRA
jgi:hypothetical protein